MEHRLWQPGPPSHALPCPSCIGLGSCLLLPPPPQLLGGPHGSLSGLGGLCWGREALIPADLQQSLSKSSASPPNSPGKVGLCWTPLCSFHQELSCFPDTLYRNQLALTLPRATAPSSCHLWTKEWGRDVIQASLDILQLKLTEDCHAMAV